MPELGTFGRRKAAALLGLAPFDCDSGRHNGDRRIRGGRAQVRHILFRSATSANRWHPDSQACYEQRLMTRGKSHRVALMAVMRKLAGLLDTLLWETASGSGNLRATPRTRTRGRSMNSGATPSEAAPVLTRDQPGTSLFPAQFPWIRD